MNTAMRSTAEHGHDASALFARLEALGAALGTDALDEAGSHMSAYDTALRRFIDTTAPHTPVDVLQSLLDIQHDLLARMGTRKREVGDALRRLNRQGSASRAYAAMDGVP